MSQFFNILTKKDIIINETTGEQKTLWFTAGSLKVTDKGRSYLTLFQSPDVDYFVFPKRTEEELPTVQLEDSTDENYDATK